jgi:hypothetical protein
LPSKDMKFKAFLILVEPNGDYFFSSEGVCIISADQTYTVYCLDSRHNFLRAAVLKFPLSQLIEHPVLFRGAQVKLEDLSEFREQHGLADSSAHALISAIYERNRERHYYLERYVMSVQ